MTTPAHPSQTIIPLELLDKCIGSDVWILMRTEREISGCLQGFDDFFNMVIDDATEIEVVDGEKVYKKLDTILLNGTQICSIIPGGCPELTE